MRARRISSTHHQMAEKSEYLASLDKAGRAGLEQRLLKRQSGKCFICDEAVDLVSA